MDAANLNVTIKRVDALPLVKHYIEELGLPALFEKYVPNTRGFEIPPSQVLCLLVANITMSAKPLYQVEDWLAGYMDGEAELPFEASKYNDDRIVRCLDELFDSNRNSMQAETAAMAIKVHNLECEYIHNDTTTVTFSGAYDNPEAGAAVPAHGYNKDHRPDLKQVVFGLNTTADGHVPVGYHLYDGNQADVTTHTPNWEGLRELLGKADFIYIADSKLCDMKTLALIAVNGGRFITIMPANRKEVTDFMTRLRQGEAIEWEAGYDVEDSRKRGKVNRYRLYSGEQSREGYRIVWVHSSTKAEQEANRREKAIHKMEQELEALSGKLNKYRLRTKEHIEKAVAGITKRACGAFLQVEIIEESVTNEVQVGKGRPGPKTRYETVTEIRFTLQWRRDEEEILQVARCDGIFPLTDNTGLEPAEVLKHYKDQPGLEKRHSNLKSVLEVAPVFLNKPSRIEAMMFLYFIALMIVTLIERNIRTRMQEQKVEKLSILPSGLNTERPTWNNIRYFFNGIHLTVVTITGDSIRTMVKGVTPLHQKVLHLLKIPILVYRRLKDGWWQFGVP